MTTGRNVIPIKQPMEKENSPKPEEIMHGREKEVDQDNDVHHFPEPQDK